MIARQLDPGRLTETQVDPILLFVDLEDWPPRIPSSATVGVKEIRTAESPGGFSLHQASRICYGSSESKTSKTKSDVPGISSVRQVTGLPDYVRTPKILSAYANLYS